MTRRLFLPLLLAGCSTTANVKPALPPVAESPPSPAPAPSVDSILAASRLPEPLAAPLDGDPMGVSVHRLSNGLTVFISRMPAVPTVRAWTVVRAGSRHDPAAWR